jgi:hypothetical protein
MSSAWEHFFSAAVLLASVGPIKQRLTNAFTNHIAQLRDDDLPRELRDDFSSLVSSLSRVPPMRGETAIQATVRKMSDIEAGKHAEQIVILLGTMARLQSQSAYARPPLLRAVSSGE